MKVQKELLEIQNLQKLKESQKLFPNDDDEISFGDDSLNENIENEPPPDTNKVKEEMQIMNIPNQSLNENKNDNEEMINNLLSESAINCMFMDFNESDTFENKKSSKNSSMTLIKTEKQFNKYEENIPDINVNIEKKPQTIKSEITSYTASSSQNKNIIEKIETQKIIKLETSDKKVPTKTTIKSDESDFLDSCDEFLMSIPLDSIVMNALSQNKFEQKTNVIVNTQIELKNVDKTSSYTPRNGQNAQRSEFCRNKSSTQLPSSTCTSVSTSFQRYKSSSSVDAILNKDAKHLPYKSNNVKSLSDPSSSGTLFSNIFLNLIINLNYF